VIRLPGPLQRAVRRLSSDAVVWAWQRAQDVGRVQADSRLAARFARFGPGSTIAFPLGVLHGIDRVEIGVRTLIGPNVTLSAGMPLPLDQGRDPLLVVGDRVVLGKGSAIVAHARVEIGDDTMTGHSIYITDQNHGYEDLDVPIGVQMWKNNPVRVGPACWIGHGAVLLPGTTLGRHVVVAAGSVVRGEIPDHCVVAGVPARIVRRHVAGLGWVATDPDGTPRTG
jgi:carbonic anhydrase/acetyltransferase-like protein (isoleucine patch superfamily)